MTEHTTSSRFSPTTIERFWAKVKRLGPNDCWEWQAAKDRHQYGIIEIQYRQYRAHRIAYELTFGEFSSELSVLHKCDNPPCCNPSHLFLGTRQDNHADMVSKGRNRGSTVRGERVHLAKLTAQQVSDIRQKFNNGFTRKALATEYAVTLANICDILNRKTWKHVP